VLTEIFLSPLGHVPAILAFTGVLYAAGSRRRKGTSHAVDEQVLLRIGHIRDGQIRMPRASKEYGMAPVPWHNLPSF
jgi:hypothetical protein